MTTINTIKKPRRKTWTVADLYRRFGPIPFERIRHEPAPGLWNCRRRRPAQRPRRPALRAGRWHIGGEDRGTRGILHRAEDRDDCSSNFVEPRGLGLVAGADGTIQLDINLVRIPDVSFFSLKRLPGGEIPKDPVPLLVPDLAVEVISRSNTPKEMAEKLQEYFEKGVRLVWYVRPRSRVVDVYTAPDHFTRLTAIDAARRRRCPARFFGPGRRAV